ncbi:MULTISPECIES: hypothetical protein, partial [unclassified Bradyrhizobium]|uniref:hypothetical protein n=1 Tax=unclassified Bradyrhizobium TaxID=2631580 RepID=UPI003394E3E5
AARRPRDRKSRSGTGCRRSNGRLPAIQQDYRADNGPPILCIDGERAYRDHSGIVSTAQIIDS